MATEIPPSTISAPKPESMLGTRHLVITLMFLATTVSYGTRVSMSVAIVAMTDKNASPNNDQVFDWDASIRDTILSSFFWGYIMLQIPAGMLAARWGGARLLTASMIVTGAANLILPTAAGYVSAKGMFADARVPDFYAVIRSRVAGYWNKLSGAKNEILQRVYEDTYNDPFKQYWSSLHRSVNGRIVKGWQAVTACRVLTGLAQGILYPSIHGLLGHWAPVEERSRMGTFVYAGSQLGTIIEMVLAGALSASSWGWPSVFYVSGATCLGWTALWMVFGASTPGTSRWITKEERKYVETSAGTVDITQHKSISTPWRSILTCLPFWAIILAHSGQSLGFWTLLTEMPLYMSKVLGVDIKSNGILSSLPYVAMYLLSFVFSWLSDFLVNRRIVSLATTRKIFNTIAFWGPAAALMGLCYVPAGHLTLAVILLTVTVGLNGAHYVGFLISHIDLSPNYASTLMGVTNCVGNIFSILAPYSVSIFVRDETNATEWRTVFFISIGFYFLSNLFYILFMSGTVQPWNELNANTSIEDGVNEKKSKKTSAINEGEHKF